MKRRLILTGIAAMLVTAIVGTPHVLRGPRLGRVIGWALPPLRGQIQVGGGSWTWGAVWALWRGRPAAFVLDDVRLTDPDGTRVFQARHLTAAVQVNRGQRAIVVHDLQVTDAFWLMAETKDHRSIGFLAVFERPTATTPKVTGPSPAGASVPLSFRIADARLHGLDAEFALPGWALTLRRIDDAGGSLALAPDAGGRSVFTFEVTNAHARAGGSIAVLDGARRMVLPFSTAQIARVATTPAAPDAIELDARAIETGASVSTLRGRFTHVFGKATGPPAAALEVAIAEAADAVAAVAAGHPQVATVTVHGRGARLAFSVVGRLAAPVITADAERFDFTLRGLPLNALAFHLDSQPTARLLRLGGLTFTSPAGGHVTVDGALDHLLARGRVVFDHFDAGPFLPAPLLPFVGGTLDGHVRALVDLARRTARIDDTDLSVSRPPHVAGPAVVRVLSDDAQPARAPDPTTVRFTPTELHDGTLSLPKVTSTLWGGRVTARGRLRLWDSAARGWMPSPWFEVKVDATGIAFERLLGSEFVTGTVSLRAEARGTLQALALDASFAPHQRVRLLGDWFTLPPTIRASVDAAAVTVPRLVLRGQAGSALAAQGRLGLAGELALTIDVLGFPLRNLPGLADLELPLDGQLEGQLRLSGPRGFPAVEGRLSIVDARFRGRPIGAGALSISPAAHGGIHARGQIVEGLLADGTLTPLRGAVLGDVTLTLRQLRLDPFLSGLPGGISAGGVVSGVVRGRVAPDARPSVDARLSELALLITGPSQAARGTPQGTARPTIDVHSDGEVHVTAQAKGGAIVMAPARFVGRAGTLDLSGEAKGGAAKGRVRGHLDLDELGALAKPWFEHLAGAVDFDAEAALPAGGARAALRGSVAVTSPVRMRLRQLPIDAVLASGRIVLTDDGAATRDLPITLGRETIVMSGQVSRLAAGSPRLALELHGSLDPRLVEPFARTVVRDLEGRIGLDARIDGSLAAPAARAHLNLDQTAFTLAQGGQRIELPAGAITLTLNANDRRADLQDIELRMGTQVRALIAPHDEAGRLRFARNDLFRLVAVDLPVRGAVHALPTPDVIVDDAAFALRLAGNPESQLRLTGDVEVRAAHVPEALRNRKKPPRSATTPSRARAVLDRTQLDVRLHSPKGAVTAELDHAPDLSFGVDFKVGGTVAAPHPQGHLSPAGVYSRLVLFLAQAFK